MISLKKYIKPEMEIVLVGDDIITESMGPGHGGEDPLAGIANNSLTRMNPLNRPLGIFKRD